jgi:ankyrin repeat protein
MFAAMFGHKEIVAYLIDRGADIKAQTFLGMSAVQMAKITGGVRTLFGKFVI